MRRLKTVAEMRQCQESEPVVETIDALEARWRREARPRLIGAFFGKVFRLLAWLIVLVLLAVGGWYLWGKLKSGGEGPEPSAPGKVEPSQASPDGPATPSPAQTADARAEELRQAREKRAAEQQRIKDERQMADRKSVV